MALQRAPELPSGQLDFAARYLNRLSPRSRKTTIQAPEVAHRAGFAKIVWGN